jgi:hypothetical protein
VTKSREAKNVKELIKGKSYQREIVSTIGIQKIPHMSGSIDKDFFTPRITPFNLKSETM